MVVLLVMVVIVMVVQVATALYLQVALQQEHTLQTKNFDFLYFCVIIYVYT